jgi:hypothetical protein
LVKYYDAKEIPIIGHIYSIKSDGLLETKGDSILIKDEILDFTSANIC